MRCEMKKKEGSRQKGGRRTEDGGRRTEEGGRRKEDGGRRKEEGGRRKEEGGPISVFRGTSTHNLYFVV